MQLTKRNLTSNCCVEVKVWMFFEQTQETGSVMATIDRIKTGSERVNKKNLGYLTLQPLKRNFDRVETERIYRIIENGAKNIEQLHALCCIIKRDANIFLITDLHLRHVVLNHQKLTKEPLEYARDKIANSLKDILRYCQSHGIQLSSYVKDNDTLPSNFAFNLSKLCKSMKKRLLTEVSEEHFRLQYLLQIMEKSRNFLKTMNSLVVVLKRKEADKEHQLNEKDRVVRQMKRELDAMTVAADEQNNTTLNEAAKQILTDQKAIENKTTKLGQEIIDTSSKYRNQNTENYCHETKLRKRKFKMATELYNWLQKYDQDMGWRQKQLEELKSLNDQDLEHMNEIQGHFVKVEKEYNEIMEERRIAKEKRLKQEKEARIQGIAATVIQAFWRGHFARMEFRRRKKGKNAKGKGKKGGKKK